jgi:uncharacterized protein YecE (DUF72 family)
MQTDRLDLKPKYYIGCSGWHYDHWRGFYYPQKIPKTEWLSFYAKQFNTVEINSSFYGLPSIRSLIRWKENTPDNFIFALKASRFITHVEKLRKSELALNNFLSRVSILKGKLGPLLYQLPPGIKRDDYMLSDFLSLLPSNYQYAFEFRHESWINESVFNILQGNNIAFCVTDMPDTSFPLIATADFIYMRFHGNQKMYSSCYSDRELLRWSKDIIKIKGTIKAAYIYFNNDAQALAVKNARVMMDYLSL